jgi:Nif-specific regulatory protein
MRKLADLASGQVGGSADSILRTLSDLQRRIGSAESLAEALNAVADAALVLVPRATHATLVLRDEAASTAEEGAFVPVLTRVRGPDGGGVAPTDPVRVARSVFRKVIQQRAAVLAADAPSGELSSESLLGASIRSTIGVPLFRKDAILGVLQIDNRAAPGMFTSADVDRLGVLAANASLAVANARLIHRLELAEEQLERENRFLKGRERSRRGGASEIVGESKAIKDLTVQIGKVADTRVSVLIEGETGSGKELVASALHYKSRRRDRLFIAQNCAALPENLLESELFGHKRGAFTGATEDRKGLFELADGGTLFLDEVTEMPLGLQAKLLRALQEGEVRPVGATIARHVDVRIVAATNRHIEKEVAEGRFREDLYYRLKVFPLRVPPLRERREDIPLLAGHFLSRYSAEMGKAVGGLTQPAVEMLGAYDWPGNVRELENEVQRLVIEVDTNRFITPDLLSAKIRQVEGTMVNAGVSRGSLREMMDQVERHLVIEALREHDNNKTSAAKALGITREGLHKKLKQLGIG